MMPLIPRQTSLRSPLFCIAMISMITTMGAPHAVFANPPIFVPTSSRPQSPESKPRSEVPLPKPFTRNDNTSPPHVWTRTATRHEPGWAKTGLKSSFTPQIQFMSASGAEEGRIIRAVLTDSAVEQMPETVSNGDEKLTPSISIKAQLLDAIRAQREKSINGSATSVNSDSSATLPGPTMLPIVDGGSSKHDVETHSTNHSEPPPTVNTRIGLTRTLESDLKSTDPYVRERAQKYLRLEMQLLQLRASQAAKAEHSQETSSQQAIPQQGVPAPPLVPQHSVHAEAAIPANHAVPVDQHNVTPSAADDSHTLESSASPNASLLDNMVVEGPIDRLGLANNLFAVGEYPLALEMYQQTEGTTLTSHQHFWVKYQAANCLRRLGKPAEASNLYRKLADQPEAGWLSTQARWWVETLEQIRILEKTLAEHAIDSQPAAVDKSKLKESKHDEHIQ